MSSSNEDVASLIVGACSSGRPVAEVGRALSQLIPAGTDSGRIRTVLALRQAAALLGVDASQLPALLALSLELSRANLCGSNAHFVMIEDILVARTVDELADVFDLIEHFIGVLAQSNLAQSDSVQSQRAKLSLLRICNTLLGRLPKTQDMAFRGRVLILLAKCFPIDERSGVNLKAAFNTGNVTVLESQKPSDDSELIIDFGFYRVFWSVQSYLSNPRRLVDSQTQADLMNIVDAIVSAFEGNPLTSLDVDAALDPSDCGDDAGFNAKYLTAPRLFPLQLRDPQLRRTILLQFLILFDFLLKSPSCKRVPILISIQRRLELAALVERITQTIEATPPNGPGFLAAVQRHLNSEAAWSDWKDEGCPGMQNQSIDREALRRESPATITPPLTPMGLPALNTLWNLDVDLTSPKRGFDSAKEIIEELVEEDDPEAGIEDAYKKKNDVRWCWKVELALAVHVPVVLTRLQATRMLIRTDLNLVCDCEGDFDKIVKRSTPAPAPAASIAVPSSQQGPVPPSVLIAPGPGPGSAPAPALASPPASAALAPVSVPAPMPNLEVPIAPEFCSVPVDRLPSARPVIKRRVISVEPPALPEIEDGALEETPTKRQKIVLAMNEQLQEQIALERAKKQAHDDEIRARRASRFERKDYSGASKR